MRSRWHVCDVALNLTVDPAHEAAQAARRPQRHQFHPVGMLLYKL